MQFAIVLKKLIRQRGLTTAELAHAVSISPKTISDWLAGSVPRDLNSVRACARYFHVSLHFILFGEEENLNGLPKEIVEKAELQPGRYEIIVRRVSE
jgi:transcriptional regulator with XRE-family HTH domain